MSRVKQIVMAAGTFSVALGVGFVMQNGDALASRFGSEEPAPPVSTEVQPVVQASIAPDAVSPAEVSVAQPAPAEPLPVETAAVVALPEEAGPAMSLPEPDQDFTAAVALPETAIAPQTEAAPIELAAIETEEVPDVVSDAAAEPTLAQDCVIEMSGTATSAAFVDISVHAPCHVNTAFVIHHQGMMFSVVTDADGYAEVSSPALAEVAVFIAAFPDGEGNVITTAVPEFTNFDRAVLQWEGDTSVMLSAYEFGAGFGDDGHVSRENMRATEAAISGDGGFLVQLGDASADNPLLAEVYTYPSAETRGYGEILISAEAEITSGNCGQELAAQSIQVFPNGDTQALDLTMVMPGCDAVGDFLILQNMFEDLTLASR